MPPTHSNSFPASFGWSEFFQASLDEQGAHNVRLGRVVSQSRDHYQIQVSNDHACEAAITTKMRNLAVTSSDLPAVGDWVTMTLSEGSEQASIQRVLKRRNSVQRRRSGSAQDVQLIATNVDFMLIVSSCNEDFDLERLGRYVDLGRECGCTAVLLLTKADLCQSPNDYIDQVKDKFDDIEVLAVSNKHPQSLDVLQKFFAPEKTSLLVGSSGVGKSTLTNFLLGHEAQKTQEVSSAAKGRHTTTARHLRVTKWGGLVIDTPGMQEVNARVDKEDLLKKFADVEQMALACKFTNCQHASEPGCEIKKALQAGGLTKNRWQEYLTARARTSPKLKSSVKEGRRPKSYQRK